jgi:hypothetical protein
MSKLEDFVHAGAAAQAAVDKLTGAYRCTGCGNLISDRGEVVGRHSFDCPRVPSRADRRVCPVCSDSPCGCGAPNSEREIRAIATVLEALRRLDEPARLRVLRQAAEQLGLE